MNASALSPHARLLRNSHLFSLPPSLRRESDKYNVLGAREVGLQSKPTSSAPQNQAIESSPSSGMRGDWGLKRYLPTRHTPQRARRHIRLPVDIDAKSQVTNFENASPHVEALRKWQEMGVALRTTSSNRTSTVTSTNSRAITSVFEEHLQPSVIPPRLHDEVNAATQEQIRSLVGEEKTKVTIYDKSRTRQRWRYEAPWLPGLTPHEFEFYIGHMTDQKKADFRKFVGQKLRERENSEAQFKSTERSGFNAIPEKVHGAATSEEIDVELIRLRQKPGELYRAVWEFLDFPGRLPQEGASIDPHALATMENGAPATHPSAGLFYARSDNVIHNHPYYGPMKYEKAFEARNLSIGASGVGRNGGTVTLGVGGFVAQPKMMNIQGFSRGAGDPGRLTVDGFKQFGGPKVHVVADGATITQAGHVKLNVQEAERAAVSRSRKIGKERSKEDDEEPPVEPRRRY